MYKLYIVYMCNMHTIGLQYIILLYWEMNLHYNPTQYQEITIFCCWSLALIGDIAID